MCWMALIPVAIAAFSSMQQSRAKEGQESAAADTARTNAMYAGDAADDAVARGRYQAGLQRIRTQQAVGTQRVAQAANGGMVNQDTNALLQEDTAAIGELDALTIQNNAAREAYGYKAQAITGMSNANTLSTAADSTGRNSLLGGVVSGVGAYFGGGGGLGSFGSTSGTNTQGQAKPLYNNSAYVGRL